MAKKPARKTAVSARVPSPKSDKRTADSPFVWPLVSLFVLLVGWFLYRQIVLYQATGSGLPDVTIIPRTQVNKAAAADLPPTITTYSVPTATLDKPYTGSVVALDPDANDKLTMTMGGFPLGLSRGACSVQPTNTATAKTQLVCQITGTPKQAGAFMLTISVTDGVGKSVRNEIPLSVTK
jgi:hypothetical protein